MSPAKGLMISGKLSANWLPREETKTSKKSLVLTESDAIRVGVEIEVVLLDSLKHSKEMQEKFSYFKQVQQNAVHFEPCRCAV